MYKEDDEVLHEMRRIVENCETPPFKMVDNLLNLRDQLKFNDSDLDMQFTIQLAQLDALGTFDPKTTAEIDSRDSAINRSRQKFLGLISIAEEMIKSK